MAHVEELTERDWVIGAVAGAVGTVAMTVTMEAMFRRLPRGQRYALPPRQITMRVANKAGVEPHLSQPQKTAATWLAHFGYGAAMGSLYSLAARGTHAAGPTTGACWGTAVWAGSYLGLLPALGLMKPATQQPAARNALMIAAHWVWGAATGELVKRGLSRLDATCLRKPA